MAITFYATNNFTGDGTTVNWNINFADGYIDTTNVKARYLDNTGSYVDIAISSVAGNVVTISPAVANGQEFQIYRDTEKRFPLVDFSDGAILNETNLDTLATQAVMVSAEAFDQSNNGVHIAGDSLVVAQGIDAKAQLALDNSDAAVATANAIGGKAQTALDSSAAAVATANVAASNAAGAVVTANTALSTANDAADDAATAITTANGAVTTANAATTTANAASAAASAATTTANNAANDAAAAVSTAGTALSTANTASTNASTALATANSAKTTAEGIEAKADSALAASATAVSTANAAEATANAIDGKATDALDAADSAVSTANAAEATANAASAGLASKANVTDVLNKANNLSDVPNKATARTNLGVGAVSIEDVVPVSKGGTGKTNVSDALDVLLSGTFLPLTRGGTGSGTAAAARANLGLGDSATKNVGTVAGTVAAGNDSRIVNAAQRSGFGITGVIEFLDRSTSGAPGEGLIMRAAHGFSNPGEFVNNVWQAFTPDGSYSRMQHYTTAEHAIRMVVVGTTGGTGVFSFSQTGNAVAGGSWVNAGSDERIKADIKSVENPRDILMNIRAATWKYRHKGSEGRFGIGVIANDIGQYFPDAVINTGSRELDDGTVIDNVLAVEAGDSGAMVAIHHAVLQSLVEENASQQLQIDVLSSEMDDLKALVQQLIAERG